MKGTAVASFHLSAQLVKRSVGRSAIAAAAYRSGKSLTDARTGTTHDFSRRRGVAHEEIMAPEDSAAWLRDRETLWNHVEGLENRHDAQLAREINLALPVELTHEQRLELVRTFVREQFVRHGMVADFALHDPIVAKGDDPRNFHAHVMLTLRRATPEGLHATKAREWNNGALLRVWRKAWADLQNEALARSGHRTRVDHRSLAEQRAEAERAGDRRRLAVLDRTPEIHVGPKARAAARRGFKPASHDRQVGLRYQPRADRTLHGDLQRGYSAARWRGKQRREGDGKGTERRERDTYQRAIRYEMVDRGSRVDWLGAIVRDNSDRLRSRVNKIDRQLSRLMLKLDYWERQTNWKVEGFIKGPAFRRERAIAAAEARQKREEEAKKLAHPRKRQQQIRRLIADLGMVLAGLRNGREGSLERRRELERWIVLPGRERELSRGRGGPSLFDW